MPALTAAKAAWLKLTVDERSDFVAFQASEGLTVALFDAKYLVEGNGDPVVLEDGSVRRDTEKGAK